MDKTITCLAENIEHTESALVKKLTDLQKILEGHLPKGVIIAYSGGVDSSFLLWAAKRVSDEFGGKLLALIADSPSLPRAELNEAIKFAQSINAEYIVKESRELSNPQYNRNDLERCYHCKTELFRIIGEISEYRGYHTIMYGYNISDNNDFRPGHKAAQENFVCSPLADAGLSKEDIRAVLHANGFNIAEKPASPCLSSRIMTGIPVTEKRLRDIEAMEIILREAGLRIFRVRLAGENGESFLRIETAPEEMQSLMKIRDRLVKEGVERGYRWVTLDLAGYQTGGGNR